MDTASHLSHSQSYKVTEGKKNSYTFKVCIREVKSEHLSYILTTTKTEERFWKQGLEPQSSHHKLIFFFASMSEFCLCVFMFSLRWNKFSALGCYYKKKKN